MESEISCAVCYEEFQLEGDSAPYIYCNEGHSFCLKHSAELSTCPLCRISLLQKLILNRPLISIIREIRNQEAPQGIQELNHQDLEIEVDPFASGGYADIYEAVWHGSTVAIKQIRGASDEEEKLLLKESAICAGLSHPNIVRIFGIVKIPSKNKKSSIKKSRTGIVMELYPKSLRECMKSLSDHEKFKICLGITHGLKFLHSKKIIHRDLKPENILLDGNLQPKIADFGVSKVIKTLGDSSISKQIGTPIYSPPEQMEEKAGINSPAADVYSFSMIVWEMFSGKKPFEGRTLV
jgi:serine/threonine protein kinase